MRLLMVEKPATLTVPQAIQKEQKRDPLLACFESTLAVHVPNAFGWGALPVGLLLASIQGPRMVLAPPVGWLKDCFESRTQSIIGLLSLIPFLCLLGVPGDGRFSWANVGNRGKAIYAASMAMLGA
jgi:hypothetical protein